MGRDYQDKRFGMKGLLALFSILMVAIIFSAGVAYTQVSSSRLDQDKEKEIRQAMARIHIPFIKNQGQIDSRVRYYAPTLAGAVFVTGDGEIVYSLPEGRDGIDKSKIPPGSLPETKSRGNHDSPGQAAPSDPLEMASPLAPDHRTKAVALREVMIGGKVKGVKGEGESITRVNYFIGNDPSRWKTGIPTYEQVSLGEVYDRIELRLKAYGKNLEKVFLIDKGGDPGDIALEIEGAKGIRVDKAGELEIETVLGTVKWTRPIAYQEIKGKRIQVGVKYRIQDSERRYLCRLNSGSKPLIYGFKVGDYHKGYPLIIDPLLASTFIGGSSVDEANALALDQSENIYVSGWTSSSDYPTTAGAYDTTYNGGDVFVSKLNSNLSSLISSTFIGGSSADWAYALALDPGGNIYVAGGTYSSDYPITAAAYDTTHNGSFDVFVSKLNSNLSSLLASTFIGGSNGDEASALALDQSGNIYVAGWISSSDYPITSGAYDTIFNGYSDVFVSKLNSNLSSLLSSTFIGGGSYDWSEGIALDQSENLYVSGWTSSSDYPTTAGAYDTTYNGYDDVFVSRLNSNLSSLLVSTFIGGSWYEHSHALALDQSGNIYVSGYTWSSDYPTTAGAYDTTYNGGYNDIFVSRLDSNLSRLISSTFIGGYGAYESSTALALDPSGNVYVAGWTGNSDYPTSAGAYDTTHNGSSDAFVSRLTPDLSASGPPDLVIYSSDISFDPPGPADPGTPVTIRANIHNQGGTDASCDVSFYYDDTSHLIGKVTGHAVAMGQSAVAQIVWNTTGREPRKYAIIVIISNTNPAESDTSNNQAQADYTLPVELASFEAKAGDGEILLTWVTESETDNYGWNIYRVTDPEGTFGRINSQVIPGAGTSPVAHFYSYLDQGLSNGTTYYYYLEDIRLDGKVGKSFLVSASPAAGNAALNFKPFEEEKKPVKLIPTPIPYPGEQEGPRYFPIPQAKILVDQKGSYRITYSDLAAAGIDVSGIDTRHLTLSNKGRLVPLLIFDGGDGRLDSGDYLQFEGSFNPGTYTYEDIYSRVNVYWLSWWPKEKVLLGTSSRASKDEGSPNKDVSREAEGVIGETLPLTPNALPLTDNRETIHLEENNIFSRLGHAPDGQRDHWFWAQVDAPGSLIAPFMLTNYKPLKDVSREAEGVRGETLPLTPNALPLTNNRETIRIKVRLQGNSHLAMEPDHYVQLFVNGRPLGEIRWDDQRSYLLEKEIPVSYLSEGKNTLKLVLPGLEDPSKSSQTLQNSPFRHEAIDSVFLDWLEISYWRSASPEMLQLPLKPRAIVPDFPSDLRNPNNGADYIIITHSDFYESASRLAEFREQGGLRTKVVDITDIYDEFSYGIFNPHAIKTFLQYAYKYWQRPAPSYVLLLGDASEDYKDNSHTDSRNYVPSYPYFAPGFGQTISDHWFACLEGNDTVPEVSIGRLPARTPEEAEIMVDKVINYSLGYGDSTGSSRVLFINGGYDKEDEEFFDGSSEGLIERYLGDTSKAVRVYGQPSREDLYRYQGSRDEILKAINAGVGIINFLGHAASRTWDLMFNKKDIAWLNNRSLPFVVSMTCHTGHFATTPGSNQGQGFRILTPVISQTFPGQIVMLDNGDSFGEAFLKKRDGGAIAFLGNTAMGLLYGDSYLDEELFRTVFQQGITTLGPAIDEAKRLVLKNHPGYQHLIATYVLLGDPALELKVR